MLARFRAGEQKEFADLRRSLMKLCDLRHLMKQVAWLEDFARRNGVSREIVLERWRSRGREDVTTEEGRRRWRQIWESYCCIDNL